MTMTKAVDAACIKVNVLAGTTASTNIAVTGISTEDTIIACLEFATAAAIATLTDRTSTTSITSAGNIQCTVDTTSDALLLIWLDASA
jgi:hypothetical protein